MFFHSELKIRIPAGDMLWLHAVMYCVSFYCYEEQVRWRLGFVYFIAGVVNVETSFK